MKKLASIVAVTLLCSTPAYADMSNVLATPFNWEGPYAGIHFGGIYGSFNSDPNTVGPTSDGGNVMAGLQAGYNWQRGNIVFGGEGDFSLIPFEAQGAPGTFQENWMATFRGRVGYAYGRVLPYVTLGLALTDTDSNLTGGGTSSDIHPGITAGAGVDFNCHDNWIVRGEYLYASVPTDTSVINGTRFTGGSDNHIFRIAINYKLQ